MRSRKAQGIKIMFLAIVVCAVAAGFSMSYTAIGGAAGQRASFRQASVDAIDDLAVMEIFYRDTIKTASNEVIKDEGYDMDNFCPYNLMTYQGGGDYTLRNDMRNKLVQGINDRIGSYAGIYKLPDVDATSLDGEVKKIGEDENNSLAVLASPSEAVSMTDLSGVDLRSGIETFEAYIIQTAEEKPDLVLLDCQVHDGSNGLPTTEIDEDGGVCMSTDMTNIGCGNNASALSNQPMVRTIFVCDSGDCKAPSDKNNPSYSGDYKVQITTWEVFEDRSSWLCTTWDMKGGTYNVYSTVDPDDLVDEAGSGAISAGWCTCTGSAAPDFTCCSGGGVGLGWEDGNTCTPPRGRYNTQTGECGGTTCAQKCAENNEKFCGTLKVRYYGVEVSCTDNAKTVESGGSVAYTITIKNIGNALDTFYPSISYNTNSGWSASLSAYSISLDSGASGSVDIRVYAPASAAGGSTEDVVVSVMSGGDNTKSASITTTSTAIKTATFYCCGDDETAPVQTAWVEDTVKRGPWQPNFCTAPTGTHAWGQKCNAVKDCNTLCTVDNGYASWAFPVGAAAPDPGAGCRCTTP